MLNKFKALSLAAIVVVAGAVSAGAATMSSTFDFAALANTAGEGNWGDIIGASGWTQNGITVYAGAANKGADAYLDSSQGGNVAGLGVCQYSTGTPGQCDPGSDDNVQIGETLMLSFSKLVKITDIVLRDAAHNLFTLGEAINFSNASGSGVYIVGTTGAALANLFGQSMNWDFTTAFSGEFYIASITVSAVPVPAAGLMLLSGMGIMVAARRRRKTA